MNAADYCQRCRSWLGHDDDGHLVALDPSCMAQGVSADLREFPLCRECLGDFLAFLGTPPDRPRRERPPRLTIPPNVVGRGRRSPPRPDPGVPPDPSSTS